MPVHDLLGRRSIHASFVEGGKELSTYPDYCKAQFERRTLPGERDDCVVQELEAICACLALADAGFNGKVTLDFTRSPYEIERSHRLVGTLAAAIERELGRPAVYAGTHGWCDAALLGGAGIPTVIFGPAGAGAHAAREYVSFASIIQGARILADTIVSFCGVD
jgi:acetylornithine deacetylase